VFPRTSEPLEAWTDQATQAFEFWASLWPTAPMFGVEWRFADAVRSANPFFWFEVGEIVTETDLEDSAFDTKEEVVEAAPVRIAVASSTPAASPEVVPATTDLTLIKGIGPGLMRQLNELGVTSVEQIAAMSKAKMARIDAKLASFKGRCFRDDWIGQAKALTA